MVSANPDSARSIRRLHEAKRWSFQKLEPYRKQYMNAMREYLGMHYGDNASDRRVPINLIEMVSTIYLTHLAAKNPHVLVTPKKPDNPRLRPQAADFELGIEQAMAEMRLEATLGMCAFQALMTMGICKVALTPTSEIEVEGFLHDVGEPFADSINLGDWVHDMTARAYEEVAYAGHRYRMHYDVAMDSGLFDNKARARMQPSGRTMVNETGDERPESLSQGPGDTQGNEYAEFVDLWDLWLPHENVVVTVQDKIEDVALRTVEWDGPEGGPYHLLAFNRIPSQVMPLPPASTWMDIHETANTLMRKLREQAINQKTIGAFKPGDGDEAKAITEASDGEGIALSHPDTFVERTFGGIDQHTLLYLIHLKDLFSQLCGNLDVLGGLGPQSETATQDQLISLAASKRMAAMQGCMSGFAKGIVKHIAYYEWTDPLRERMLTKTKPGSGIEVPVRWSPEVREADYLDFNFDTVPYSMQDRSPAERLQTIMHVFTRILLPLNADGTMARNNLALNVQGFLRLIERYNPDFRGGDLREMVTFIDDADVQAATANGGSPRQSPVTSRENVRVNRPGATNSGKDEAMMQILAGAGNPQTAGSVMRATG
jgi:hypothetical protein